jgi:hypothetical protein
MPAIVRMADLGLDAMWRDKPRIARWLAAIRAHPAFEPTYYFGSLLTEMFPHLKERAAARSQPAGLVSCAASRAVGQEVHYSLNCRTPFTRFSDTAAGHEESRADQ